MQVLFDGLLGETCIHKEGRYFRSPHYPTLPSHGIPPSLCDDNVFSRAPLPHLRKVSIQLELRFLFAMSENALLSVVSILHSNKIATLPRPEELTFS